MEHFEIEVMDQSIAPAEGAVIKAIGVGGGGGNMINHMVEQHIKGIELITANTDAQALDTSLAPYKIQIGKNVSRGRGCGMMPERGKEAAVEAYEDIKESLTGSDLVFIASGLGGGTGTGAAPVVAQAAKEVGALTVGVVTTPFKFEGRKRTKLAQEGLKELKKESDSVVVIPNEKLLPLMEKNLGIKESFRLVDDILSQAISAISNVILSHGPADLNLDFADVRTVMGHRGSAIIGIGKSIGANAAYDATKMALEFPLMDNISINGAMGVLVHFNIHPDYPIFEISYAMNLIEEYSNEEVSVIFGTTTNLLFEKDEVQITIIATGFENPNIFVDEIHGSPTNNVNTNSLSRAEMQQVRKIIGEQDTIKQDGTISVPEFLRKQLE